MKHLYFFWTVIKQPPLGIVLVVTAFICVLLGIAVDRGVIVFIKNNSQYFYTDIFRIIRPNMMISAKGIAVITLIYSAIIIKYIA